ncbi:metallophosphoesterase [Cohnella pontilimi]|uniref:Phosphoesterase n=1 Tax=Cohnella pontilimi TaxID=2564100 RepID=A0A4U0FGA9_9BACL|nr:metallophosphoesterase [Cohnella pontilimi]TJY43918.1 metallophosphoesterase [Cohnella pontilimi]
MKIVVVSDTHIPRMAKSLPARLVRELESNTDLILHAGDWTSEQVYDQLVRYAPVEGVAGNNDGEALLMRFGLRKKIVSGGIRIGLVHGHGPNPRLTAEHRAAAAFDQGEVDIIVFGHSHIPVLKRLDGMLLFNPGSPTDKRRQKQYSFGILSISGTDIRAKHVFYDSKDPPKAKKA